jgi:hypothetical protein
MNGFKAYQYYMAVKLHFTTDKYNVFDTRGRIKGSLDAFKNRSDRFHFERLAHKLENDKDVIQFFVSNFAYGCQHSVWEMEEAQDNYNTWIKRKESIAYIFKSDIDSILLHCEKEKVYPKNLFDFVDGNYPELLKLYVGKHITIETMRIMDDFDNFIERWKKNHSLSLLWDDERRRIEKAKGFVKYDRTKIEPIYRTFKEELTQF